MSTFKLKARPTFSFTAEIRNLDGEVLPLQVEARHMRKAALDDFVAALPAPDVPPTGFGNLHAFSWAFGDATVYIDGGQYIRLQSPDPRYGEAQYYVDAQGVRYGVANDETAKALGLSGASTAPWQVVGLLMEGPVLSKEAALLEHDTLPSDPKPRKVADGREPIPTTVRPGGAS